MILEIITLGGLGSILSIGLGLASKKFHVETDPRVEQVSGALPQANCGACGFPGCLAYAEKVVSGEAGINSCSVGGNKVAKNIGMIMGIESASDGNEDKKSARIICRGGAKEAIEKFKYDGVMDCRAAILVSGGSKACVYGCLGLGTCARECPFDAISMNENNLPVVNMEKCTACGICVNVCPKSVIELMPISKNVQVRCSSKEKGVVVRKICTVGCIGCSKCVKTCPYNAISISENLAKIDYIKCTNCGLCVKSCPTNSIYDYTVTILIPN